MLCLPTVLIFSLRCELPTRCFANYSSGNRQAVNKNAMFFRVELTLPYLDLYKDELLGWHTLDIDKAIRTAVKRSKVGKNLVRLM